ncbi:Hypothetical protein CINCED_3A013384 [Cinara cedri]|nr:Hypothetical protein CINCED_3A013384 [Cinara cedri]
MRVESCDVRFWTAAAFTLAVAHVPPVENARILAVETFPGKSHWNFVSAVLRALTDGGHHVTVFTPFPEGDRANYTEVDTSDRFAKVIAMDLTALKRLFSNPLTIVAQTMKMFRADCDSIYGDRRLTDLLADDPAARFDAILIEPGPPACLTYAAVGTGLPVVHAVPNPKKYYADRWTDGEVSNPAAVTTMMARQAVPKTFVQRFTNTLLSLYIELAGVVFDSAMFAVGTAPHHAHAPVPPSVVFNNGHYISDAPRPVSPNTVNVGGIHLKPVGSLPKDILEFIEDSPHGVILFTFGSTVLMSSLPNHMKTVIIEALAQLPQRVLLKYEDEMENKPDNVMIRKWLPQRDILAHPKVKLFVSHGGISGVYEAVDAGVPVLGFPLFADQHRNIDNLVEAGMAISMELFSVTTGTLFKNLVELVNNEKYAKNAKIASDIFKDRPMSPQQSVVYWVEYVIRHKGAPHLKSQAFNLTWYEYFLLDVIAAVSISIATVSYAIFRLFKIVFQYSFKRPRTAKIKPE